LLLEVEKLNTFVFIKLHQRVNVTRLSHYIPLWPLRVTHPTGPDKGTFVGLLTLVSGYRLKKITNSFVTPLVTSELGFTVSYSRLELAEII